MKNVIGRKPIYSEAMGKIDMRLPSDLKKAIAAAAAKSGMGTTTFLRQHLEQAFLASDREAA
jgi:predicted DNA binding CopG/RHH family protein